MHQSSALESATARFVGIFRKNGIGAAAGMLDAIALMQLREEYNDDSLSESDDSTGTVAAS